MSTPLPFNFMEVETATGFDYPEGDYIFEVEKTEERMNQDGQNKRLLVGSKIIMGPYASEEYKGRKLSNSYQLTTKGAGFLKRLFIACEIGDDIIRSAGGQLQADWLVGRQYVATVFKNGQYTNITNERPLSEWDPTKVATPPPQKAAPAISTPPPAIMQPAQPAALPQQAVGGFQPPVVGAPPMQQQAQFAPPMQPQMQAPMQPQAQAPMQPQMPAQAAAPAMPQMAGASAPPMAPPPMQMAATMPPAPPVQQAAAPMTQPPQQAAAPMGIPAPAPPPGPVTQG